MSETFLERRRREQAEAKQPVTDGAEALVIGTVLPLLLETPEPTPAEEPTEPTDTDYSPDCSDTSSDLGD